MAIIRHFFLYSLLLLSVNAYGLNNPSISERIWIKKNLLKPEANLIFIVSVNKAMLVSPQTTEMPKENTVNFQSMTQNELKQFLAENPSELNNTAPLLALANLEILSADFSNARIHIDKAYALAPTATEIYVSELLYQFYYGLIQLQQSAKKSDTAAFTLSSSFLVQAEKEHPEYEIPKMVHHGLKVLQIFYSVLLGHIDQFKQHRAFEFVLDPDLQQTLNNSKAYFQALIKNQTYNPYFANMCLLMLAIIENDTQVANHYFAALRLLPEADNNLYRLMTINAIARAQFASAIGYLKDSIQHSDNSADRQMLASLYSLKGDQHLALKILQNYKGRPSPELLIHQLGYTLLTGDFIAASKLLQNYKQFQVLLQIPQFVYYTLIIDLLNSEYASARQHLPALSDSQVLYKNAQLFIDHFNRTEKQKEVGKLVEPTAIP